MSKYRSKFKTINTQLASPLEEIINALGQTEQSEPEQLEHLEHSEQLSHNRNSLFYRINNDDKLNCAVLIIMLSGMLIFTASFCSQDNNHAITGLSIALAGFYLRVVADIINEFMENNSNYVYQSHYRN
ncbi:TPA: hypothetical protein ACTUT5_001922 [Legionella anisa]|uniref:Uncharacterized protein n=1 Tax=Legionella anisa TaxID=28082 RepID=A0AAX0WWR1_9GAMM|nr:hypothetical protein [Legionella anisa]AWN73493.1 hypothetical protein DLD14_06350 [Legionella anisa]MBN5935364.1 hypothetical protein [Legionella anisa]MCW8426367.1 hypothetical protein [Legionella anisa]MCW8448027.1 hypothetical protein [Legionella anisa]PNL62595.1 hypothetical protein A6J39_016045 [Legionella anisa]